MTKKRANKKPIILVTNDDGIYAPGLHALVEAVKDLGEIVVVAPDKPQSGMGHAITIGLPLRLTQTDIFDGIEAWQCTGTPVDCVKIAVDKILKEKPDICISGINHGLNHSINVIYSGTMSAAMEGSIENIPSIGFSLNDFRADAEFDGAKEYARIITEKILSKVWDQHICLNVNIPRAKTLDIKGVKICKQAYAKYQESFVERLDPAGKKYFWLTGEFVNFDTDEDTDVWALQHNYVSVVPVNFDLTHYEMKKKLDKIMKRSDNVKKSET